MSNTEINDYIEAAYNAVNTEYDLALFSKGE